MHGDETVTRARGIGQSIAVHERLSAGPLSDRSTRYFRVQGPIVAAAGLQGVAGFFFARALQAATAGFAAPGRQAVAVFAAAQGLHVVLGAQAARAGASMADMATAATAVLAFARGSMDGSPWVWQSG